MVGAAQGPPEVACGAGRAARGQRPHLQHALQGAPQDQAHHEEGRPIDCLDGVDLAQVGMPQPRLGPCLAQKALDGPMPKEVGVQALERHLAVEVPVDGPVDHPHATPPKLLHQQVAAQLNRQLVGRNRPFGLKGPTLGNRLGAGKRRR